MRTQSKNNQIAWRADVLTVGFSFFPDWLRECCELSEPITEQGKAKQRNPGFSGHSIER